MHGRGKNKYKYNNIGLNSRLDTIQAAILLAKLEIFLDEIKKRKSLSLEYRKKIKNVSFQKQNNFSESSNSLFTIKTSKRNKLISALKKNNISFMIYYPVPLHKQKVYNKYLKFNKNNFENSIKLSRSLISLPFHPYLNLKDLKFITKIVNENVL